nr:response regulator transcription factor [Pseudomonas luteola]
MEKGNSIRVAIVDDHALVREGVATLLGLVPDIFVVGESGSGKEALSNLHIWGADIVIVDIGMSEINGLLLTKQIKKEYSEVQVIILSMYDKYEYVSASLEAGASAYVLKNSSSKEIIAAIHAVSAGGTYLSAELQAVLLASDLKTPCLTPRETDILKMLAQGKNNKEIAKLFNISVRTVETHRLSLRKKLGIDTVAGLVVHAMENHLI